MKNYIRLPILFSGFFVIFSLSACGVLNGPMAQTNNNLLDEKNKTPNTSPTDNRLNQPSETSVKKMKFTPAKKIAWYGSVSIDQLKVSNNSSSWIGDDENPEYNQIGMVIDVDILNCAGYLQSGRMHKEEDYGWRFEVMPESVAFDAAQKIERCYMTTKPEDNSEGVFSGAFAVAPQDNKRQKVIIPEINTAKVFASLPKDTKKWLNEEKIVYKTEYGASLRRKARSNLSLIEGDDWTDIDGDGEIDLVYVSSICRAEDGEGDNCGRLLMRIYGKWKQVGLIQKA